MSFYEEMAELVVELLGDGPDSFGEDVIITRASVEGYDPETRETIASPPLRQVVRGSFDTELTATSMPGGLTATYEQVLTAAPRTEGGFQPGQADRVLDVSGNAFIVRETAHVVKQGRPIAWICGLVSA